MVIRHSDHWAGLAHTGDDCQISPSLLLSMLSLFKFMSRLDVSRIHMIPRFTIIITLGYQILKFIVHSM